VIPNQIYRIRSIAAKGVGKKSGDQRALAKKSIEKRRHIK
jgi:hypothetical protein